jgi:hypothetical protein
MQALGVVDVLDELTQIAVRLLKALILFKVHFLLLQGLEKRLGFRVVRGVASA